MLNKLMLELKEYNVYNTDVEEVEYYGGWANGLTVYFPSGECLQVIEDNKKMVIVNEYLEEVETTEDINAAAVIVSKCYYEKMEEINNSGSYISVDDFICQFNKR